MDINEIVLSGRVSKDPRVGYTMNGTPFITFSLGVERPRPYNPKYDNMAAQANGKEPPAKYNYFPIHCIGAIAEKAAGTLSEGTSILIHGYLRQRPILAGNGKGTTGWATEVEMKQFIRIEKVVPEPPAEEDTDVDDDFF